MVALVTVAGVALPEPSTYNGNTSTLVDSARNTNGVVVGSVVRSRERPREERDMICVPLG